MNNIETRKKTDSIYDGCAINVKTDLTKLLGFDKLEDSWIKQHAFATDFFDWAVQAYVMKLNIDSNLNEGKLQGLINAFFNLFIYSLDAEGMKWYEQQDVLIKRKLRMFSYSLIVNIARRLLPQSEFAQRMILFYQGEIVREIGNI